MMFSRRQQRRAFCFRHLDLARLGALCGTNAPDTLHGRPPRADGQVREALFAYGAQLLYDLLHMPLVWYAKECRIYCFNSYMQP